MNRFKSLTIVALLTGIGGGFLLGRMTKPQPAASQESAQFAKRQDGQMTTLRADGWGLQGYGNLLLG